MKCRSLFLIVALLATIPTFAQSIEIKKDAEVSLGYSSGSMGLDISGSIGANWKNLYLGAGPMIGLGFGKSFSASGGVYAKLRYLLPLSFGKAQPFADIGAGYSYGFNIKSGSPFYRTVLGVRVGDKYLIGLHLNFIRYKALENETYTTGGHYERVWDSINRKWAQVYVPPKTKTRQVETNKTSITPSLYFALLF